MTSQCSTDGQTNAWTIDIEMDTTHAHIHTVNRTMDFLQLLVRHISTGRVETDAGLDGKEQ